MKALPKGALLEKQVLVHTGRIPEADLDDGTIYLRSHRHVFSEGGFLSIIFAYSFTENPQDEFRYRMGSYTGKSPEFKIRLLPL